MRNTRALIMMVAAVIAGLGAVVIGARWLSQQATSSANKLVVAGSDIDLGSRLTPAMLKAVEWPANSMPKGAFANPADLDSRVLRTSVLSGEPVLESKLAPVGSKGGLSAVVAEGKRAMTVRVNDVIGVAGFALPGNYVDIIVNTQEEGAKGGNKDQTISKIVLEHILVLAVAQEVGRDETKPKVVSAVTVEVTPEQAEKLDLARSVGTLSLVLRNQVDPKMAGTDGATKAKLLNTPPEPVVTAQAEPPKPPVVKKKPVKLAAAPEPAPRINCVEVIRGITSSTQCF
ncbi:MAG TPA: Flp pilus assembly protein CpaB [Casimicrobiaceae bacterium]|jgi:pilus assembly protein CpaB|nr:Flp pilus assembly protein CpaB [Casimicrobiaceae bacterium]